MGNISKDLDKTVHKNICLRIPKEMLDRIDINTKNSKGYSRTTWVLQALDRQLKSGDDISIPYGKDINYNADPIRYIAGPKSIDSNIVNAYNEDMKVISKSLLIKILVLCLIVGVVAGCVGGAAGSVFSLWSATSGVSGESLRTHEVCPKERGRLVKDIKEEVIRELLEQPPEIIEIAPSAPTTAPIIPEESLIDSLVG